MSKSNHKGQRCISLGFGRTGSTLTPINIRLQIQDDDMQLTEVIDMDPKQFADFMSGMATWVDDHLLEGHKLDDAQALIAFAMWLEAEKGSGVFVGATPRHLVSEYLKSKEG